METFFITLVKGLLDESGNSIKSLFLTSVFFHSYNHFRQTGTTSYLDNTCTSIMRDRPQMTIRGRLVSTMSMAI
jgi:hypothetical protein